jgi:chromosome segregation ATPase
METNPNQKNNNSKLLIVLLILSVIGNIWQWNGRNTVEKEFTETRDSLITVQVDVEKELNETYAELNQYKGINGRLDSLLQEANGKVDEQKARIEALLRKEGNSAALNKKLMAELKELQGLRDQYLEKIDALLIENENLKKDKENLSNTIENLNKNLESTVTTASALKAEYMKATASKKRSNGKYTATVMARRTNKLELCFSLLENKIAKAGERTVHLRIVEPGGNVLGNRSDGSGSFRKTGSNEELLFTSSQKVEYKNDKTDICINYEDVERNFTSGTYLMEVYVDGNLSGTTSVKLQ